MTDWSRIVQEHGPSVWATAYRLLNNTHDAADCFQNVFLTALQRTRSEEVRSWKGLLKTITVARALERLRQRYRESGRYVKLSPHDPADEKALDPIASAEAGELADQLRDALARIEPRHARVFCLVCVEGLTYQEVARHEGITGNHVGVLLNRARAELRKRLERFAPPGIERPSRETR